MIQNWFSMVHSILHRSVLHVHCHCFPSDISSTRAARADLRHITQATGAMIARYGADANLLWQNRLKIQRFLCGTTVAQEIYEAMQELRR
jgi:hypothetical protein